MVLSVKPFPAYLGKLSYNLTSGRYEVTANGTTYHLDLEQLNLIHGHLQSIAAWYDSLDKTTKEKIWITISD